MHTVAGITDLELDGDLDEIQHFVPNKLQYKMQYKRKYKRYEVKRA